MQELQPPTQLWKPVWSIKRTLGKVEIALEHTEITFERIRGPNLTAFPRYFLYVWFSGNCCFCRFPGPLGRRFHNQYFSAYKYLRT